MKKIILASGSPQRKKIMQLLDIPFKIVRSSAEERTEITTTVSDLVKDNALLKAIDVAEQMKKPSIVIGADTVVYAKSRLILKPKDLKEAKKNLKLLMEEPHWVYTGVAIIDTQDKTVLVDHDKTKVFMKELNDDEIDRYHKMVSPLDKAGGFDIEGRGGRFIHRIEGCYFNVVGLPAAKLVQMLKKFGVHALMFVAALWLYGYCGSQVLADDALPKVCSPKTCFTVELATTSDAREQGLMYRESLDQDKGMLFIFDEPGRYSFWMKNMKIPIDICWIDEDKRIIDVKSNLPPCEVEPCALYTPKSNARYVLEIAAGAANATGLKPGEPLKF